VAGIEQLVRETLDVFGGADVLLNNVGGSPMVPFLDLTDQQIWDAWNLKLLGAIRLTQALVPVMEKRGGGSVINIGGGGGHDMAPELLLAATTINVVRAFTKAVAPDLAQRGIAVNVITPGPTRTDRHFNRARMMAESRETSVDTILHELDRAVPTGHVTEPEEVAQLVLFLASRHVHNLTGAEITLDGGASRAW
jgi:3-oxoacyl-[acyl-carrier protein] reductase